MANYTYERSKYGGCVGSIIIHTTPGISTSNDPTTAAIKDDIPAGQTWSIVPLGALNRFSYSTTRAGTTNVIKWIVSTQVISIAWA